MGFRTSWLKVGFEGKGKEREGDQPRLLVRWIPLFIGCLAFSNMLYAR